MELLGDMKHPKSIIKFQKPHPSVALHRTQKPVDLLEWLVKTYTNEGMIVLDNCAGSGSLGEACLNVNREFIMIEKNPDDYIKMKSRIIKIYEIKKLDYSNLFSD